MKTIISGTRTIANELLVAQAVDDSGFDITEVVSGGCRGIDLAGEAWANSEEIPVRRFPYLREHGRAGGPIRNRQMACYADALIAIWDGRSRGTKNMIDLAYQHGLKVYVMRAAQEGGEG